MPLYEREYEDIPTIPHPGAGYQPRSRTRRGVELYPQRGMIRLPRPYTQHFDGRRALKITSPGPGGQLQTNCACSCYPPALDPYGEISGGVPKITFAKEHRPGVGTVEFMVYDGDRVYAGRRPTMGAGAQADAEGIGAGAQADAADLGLAWLPIMGGVVVVAGAIFSVGYTAYRIIKEIKGLKSEGNEERIQELVSQAQENFTSGKIGREELEAILAAARVGSAEQIEDRGSTFMIPWVGKVPKWAVYGGAGLLGFLLVRMLTK